MAIVAQASQGVGGAAVGIVTAELIESGENRGLLTDRQARLLSHGVGLGAVGVGAAGLAGVVGLPGSLAPVLVGTGLGAMGWRAGRDAGIAPDITLDIPDEVNLAGPLATATALSIVGLAIGTAAHTAGAI